MDLADTQPMRPPTQRRRRELLAMGALTLLFLCIGAAFFVPWLPSTPPGGALVQHYLPVKNGRSTLAVIYDPNNNVQGWISSNTLVQANISTLAFLPEEFTEVIDQRYTQPGESRYDLGRLIGRLSADNAQIVETWQRRLTVNGEVTASHRFIYLRNRQGEFLLGWIDELTGTPIVWQSPLQTWQDDLLANGRLQNTSTSAAGSYQSSITAHQLGDYAGHPAAAFEDCVVLQTDLRLQLDGVEQANSTAAWACAGYGVVMTEQHDPAGNLVERWQLVATDDVRLLPNVPLPPAPAVGPETAVSPSPTDWELTRFGRATREGLTLESSISPVYLPADPPLLLAASLNNALTAFNATTGERVWQFMANGTIFSRPLVDMDRGRIYFGASDKKLYALDTNGVFLWAVATQDNVTTRPALFGDTLLVGSEDKQIYCVDVNTAVITGQVATNGAVAGSPGTYGKLALFGADDGGVYAVDAETCALAWLYAADDAVEAPVQVVGELAFVAGRSGLVVLDAAVGTLQWQVTDVDAIQFAPALAADRLLVVDEVGQLTAYARENGRRLWHNDDVMYIGAPLVVGDALLVAVDGGELHQLSLDGELQSMWRLETAAANADEIGGNVSLGPVLGGGAVWLADSKSVLRKLTPVYE